ncbi:MAG TPA: lipase maturation factor family protein [Bryobacteraceae bacterium]|jgi:hypothetical protein|nr:lipase maturation factor family protein [Bryobacteraceae bacterium]
MKIVNAADQNYWLSQFVFTRALALVYLIAFLCALNQAKPLIGEHGLLPLTTWVREVPFRATPSLFYLWPNDRALTIASWCGIVFSCLLLSGTALRYSSAIAAAAWLLVWVLYLSFVNIGQTFYGFGWESLLLEAGFFAMFLGGNRIAPPLIGTWMFRWLEFRLMFGAGLIKLRGDPCWRDLTCLNYHYQTQPMPNPLSWYFHWAPQWTHTGGVLFNHFSELIVPFGYLLPQPIGSIAAIITIVFQGAIMASGNLSWLNFLTIVLAIPLIATPLSPGRWLAAIIPIRPPALSPPGNLHSALLVVLAIVVGILSVQPIRNMLSPTQAMNASFNPFHLVGTYGAFGSVTRQRFEVIIEGARDDVVTASTQWTAYEFKGKPGDPSRMPPQIAPYHLRLDWLMWFAAFSTYEQHPWFVHLMGKLLEGDRDTLGLLASNPFPDKPPRFVRAQLYEYKFATPEEHRKTGAWWTRRFVDSYFPAVSLNDPGFVGVLRRQGWL